MLLNKINHVFAAVGIWGSLKLGVWVGLGLAAIGWMLVHYDPDAIDLNMRFVDNETISRSAQP